MASRWRSFRSSNDIGQSISTLSSIAGSQNFRERLRGKRERCVWAWGRRGRRAPPAKKALTDKRIPMLIPAKHSTSQALKETNPRRSPSERKRQLNTSMAGPNHSSRAMNGKDAIRRCFSVGDREDRYLPRDVHRVSRRLRLSLSAAMYHLCLSDFFSMMNVRFRQELVNGLHDPFRGKRLQDVFRSSEVGSFGHRFGT